MTTELALFKLCVWHKCLPKSYSLALSYILSAFGHEFFTGYDSNTKTLRCHQCIHDSKFGWPVPSASLDGYQGLGHEANEMGRIFPGRDSDSTLAQLFSCHSAILTNWKKCPRKCLHHLRHPSLLCTSNRSLMPPCASTNKKPGKTWHTTQSQRTFKAASPPRPSSTLCNAKPRPLITSEIVIRG